MSWDEFTDQILSLHSLYLERDFILILIYIWIGVTFKLMDNKTFLCQMTYRNVGCCWNLFRCLRLLEPLEWLVFCPDSGVTFSVSARIEVLCAFSIKNMKLVYLAKIFLVVCILACSYCKSRLQYKIHSMTLYIVNILVQIYIYIYKS